MSQINKLPFHCKVFRIYWISAEQDLRRAVRNLFRTRSILMAWEIDYRYGLCFECEESGNICGFNLTINSTISFETNKGGYGSVYKGKLSDGVSVAVKILEHLKANGEDFINEVAVIGRIQHFNIVRLLGFCLKGTRRALIYEFLFKGSLKKFIFANMNKSTTFKC
ncbi:hypothetical protein Ddye_030096 [Dipteronia dyeriana]|uniref:Protein kinase domain-containing protein n=1 Tax=Dipteronia dyeriana TaxID=168575 RepID=A0AAD9TFN4_9ROSI|nr:hypothetical protein Ddye_030096 [Dipteronia dyeriana]